MEILKLNKLVKEGVLVLDKVLTASVNIHWNDSDESDKSTMTKSLDSLEGKLIRQYSLESQVPFLTGSMDIKDENVKTQYTKYSRKTGFYVYNLNKLELVSSSKIESLEKYLSENTLSKEK